MYTAGSTDAFNLRRRNAALARYKGESAGHGYDFVLEPVPEDDTIIAGAGGLTYSTSSSSPLRGRAYYDAHDKRFEACCMYDAARNNGKRSRKPRVLTNMSHDNTGKSSKSSKSSKPAKKRLKPCLVEVPPDTGAKKRRKTKKHVSFDTVCFQAAETLADSSTDSDTVDMCMDIDGFAIMCAAEALSSMCFT